MKILQYAVFPGSIICLFYVEEYGDCMEVFNGSFSEKTFEVDYVINSAPVFTETILYWGYEFFFSRHHIKWLLIVLSNVLQRQLVKATEQ